MYRPFLVSGRDEDTLLAYCLKSVVCRVVKIGHEDESVVVILVVTKPLYKAGALGALKRHPLLLLFGGSLSRSYLVTYLGKLLLYSLVSYGEPSYLYAIQDLFVRFVFILPRNVIDSLCSCDLDLVVGKSDQMFG